MAVLYSPMGGLCAHITRSAQLFALEYQHHRKVDLRRPPRRAGRRRRRVWVHAINLGQTFSIGFLMVITASGFGKAMPHKQPSQWELSRTTLWLEVRASVLLVRCRTVDRTCAPSGENGRKTNINRHSRASCACLACCWSPLACTQCVVLPRAAVIRGRYTFCEKSLENKGSATKGYSCTRRSPRAHQHYV